MSAVADTAYIVFDSESVVDGALLSKVAYPGENLAPEEAVARYEADWRRDNPGRRLFVPVSFHVPVAIGIARVAPDFRLIDLVSLDAPRYDPQVMVAKFWRGLEAYSSAVLVDFNGRGFDIPLLTLSAFRFGVSCPRYFADPDRFGFRYRFTSKHLDLMDWLSEYGAWNLAGGLNLLAKLLGKPGKMSTTGDQVADLYLRGELQRIADYCLHDVLDTYFVFLRTRVLAGEIALEEEQRVVAEMRDWVEARAAAQPGLKPYLDAFGRWDPTPFR